MKNSFFEYYKNDIDKIRENWEKALFVFDANVLLNFYRYSKETSEKFLQVIKSLGDRVWIPHQVGLEYHKNRLFVISNEMKVFKDFKTKVEAISSEIENQSRNPFFSPDLTNDFQNIKQRVFNEIQIRQAEFENLLLEDKILNDITKIFNGKVGPETNGERLKEIYKSGEDRYKNDLPPGYEDKQKPAPRKFGDLVLWFQIIDKSVADKRPIVLIIDDRKEDWWRLHHGLTISPRVELIREFRDMTNQDCMFYKPFNFLSYLNQFNEEKVSQTVLDEVESLQPSVTTPIEIIYRIRVKCQEGLVNIGRLIERIKADGYIVDLGGNFEDLYTLILMLPNIPDLPRRFEDRHLKNLAVFGMELIEFDVFV